MKLRYLFTALTLLCFASCKKDTAPVAQPSVFSFDIGGVHHSFNIGTLQLQINDTGAVTGKYLSINTGTTAFPQVQFTLTDRTNNYAAACFSPGPYPPLSSNVVCHDSVPSSFCLGFFMQYTDTGLGKVGLYAINDSVSALTLTSCTNGTSGGPNTINATFTCVLTDSTGFVSPKQVTNGILSNIIYTK